jgi:hypothetical protein
MATQSVSFTELESAATPAATATPQAAPAENAPAPPAQAPPQFTESDLQTLRTFADAGITLTTYQDLLQAKQVVDKLPMIIKTNPRALTAEILKADPEAYDNLLEAVSDEWYEVKGKRLEQRQPHGASSTAASEPQDPALARQVATLTGQLQGLINERNQENTARQNKAIQDGFETSIESLISKLPKDVPEMAIDYARMKTRELVLKDPQAAARVAKGVYVDVPKFFAEASAKATADTKAAANQEHGRRQQVEANGSREIVPAAEATAGAVQSKPGEDPIWGGAGLEADVKAALRSK